MQNSNKEKLIYDNSFKWKYVGLMFLIWIIEITTMTLFIIVADYLINLAFTYMSGENFMNYSPSTTEIYFILTCYILLLLSLFTFTLSKMSTGKYRIDNENIYIEEKYFWKSTTNIILPLKNIKAITYKRDLSRLSPLYLLIFKNIEIKTKNESFNISCYEHRQELYDKLTEVINNQNK